MEFQLQFASVLAQRDFLLSGIQLTVLLSGGAIVLGFLLAMILSAVQYLGGRIARIGVEAYVELFRNTPFLVQLFIIFFGFPALGIRMTGVQAALLTMTLNLSAYSIEILRAGIDATHKSQIEAGASLAMTPLQIFRHVVLMPALAKVWPSLSSQFVLMLLASSIVSFISVLELSGAAAVIEQRTFRSFEVYIVVTLCYLALAVALKGILYLIGRAIFPQMSGAASSRAGGAR